MKIRKATIKDYESLKRLKVEFYNWECDRDSRLKRSYAKRGLCTRLSINLKQDNVAFFLAIQDNEVVGYSGVEIIKNPAYLNEKLQGHVLQIYIKEDFRDKGFGKLLLDKSLKWLKENKIKDIKIMTYAFNKKAYQIYKKKGFGDYIITLMKNGI